MQLGEVIGTVVASQKDPKLLGTKFLVVRNVDAEMQALGSYDIVLHVAGSSARMTDETNDRPVDACIMAIVDVVELEGRNTYEKSRSASRTA